MGYLPFFPGFFAKAATLVLACFVANSTLAAKKVEHIVVLPFMVANGVDSKVGVLLDEVVLSELAQVVPKDIKVIGSSDVNAMLGLEQQKQLLSCDDTSCLVEIGNALGATHILVPSVGKLGSKFLVSAKFLSVVDASVLFRKVLYVKANEDALLDGVKQVSHELALHQQWAPQTLALPAPAKTDQPVTAQAPGAQKDQPRKSAEESEALDPMLLAGAGLAGVGVLVAGGLGIGALVVNATTADDTSLDGDKRLEGATQAAVMTGGSALGVVILGAGAALLGISLL